MAQYRVVKQSDIRFVVEYKFFFTWQRIDNVFRRLDAAKDYIDKLSYVEKVVYETEREG